MPFEKPTSGKIGQKWGTPIRYTPHVGLARGTDESVRPYTDSLDAQDFRFFRAIALDEVFGGRALLSF